MDYTAKVSRRVNLLVARRLSEPKVLFTSKNNKHNKRWCIAGAKQRNVHAETFREAALQLIMGLMDWKEKPVFNRKDIEVSEEPKHKRERKTEKYFP